jgi:eukaryotic-like serine/threonine-protein kinase
VTNPSGRYRILRKIGEGGMGAVFAAHDERLDRPVAIKRMHGRFGDGLDEKRLWREARISARVNHPNICQIYEIAEDGTDLVLAMELLEGEPLSARLKRGPLLPAEAAQICLAVLSALAALHDSGIVHRDLKPSNIFLSQHGVKLLDFGLARTPFSVAENADGPLTQPGVLVGTPAYMAPEQIAGTDVDARSDLFVLGVVLHEMLSGRKPFAGDTVFELARAIREDQPPALGGSSSVIALDQVIHRALRKRPEERYQAAADFAQDVRAALLNTDSTEVPVARPLTRLVVLPLRLLRPDPEIDFLAFSLADAISSALSGLPSLVVRSTLAAASFSGSSPDIRALAAAVDVDFVLVGTLLRAGDQVRVNAQLIQAPSGTLLRAITSQASADDIFTLQDQLAKSVVESLSLSLSNEQKAPINKDVPSNPEAYECYLRGNQIYFDSQQWAAARDLYLRAVVLDPQFAPGWARLGRCYRLLSKYGDSETAPATFALAEDALKRALTLSPDLSLAHQLYAYVEVEAGRAREAMLRLLGQARRQASQPELFAGLVHACRYCGLLEASEAAWERARVLDPGVVTSVSGTFLLRGDYERAIRMDTGDPPFFKPMALVQSGRVADALEIFRATVRLRVPKTMRDIVGGMVALLEGRHDDLVLSVARMQTSGFRDPEGFYYWAGALAQAGDHDGALALLERAVDSGYYATTGLVGNPWFDPLRGMSDFASIVRHAEELRNDALAAFHAAEGPRVLGMAQR